MLHAKPIVYWAIDLYLTTTKYKTRVSPKRSRVCYSTDMSAIKTKEIVSWGCFYFTSQNLFVHVLILSSQRRLGMHSKCKKRFADDYVYKCMKT